MTFLYADSEDYFANLQRRLDAAGIQQAELATKAGVTGPELSRWMSGRVSPGLDKVIRLEQALDALMREQVVGARKARDGRRKKEK